MSKESREQEADFRSPRTVSPSDGGPIVQEMLKFLYDQFKSNPMELFITEDDLITSDGDLDAMNYPIQSQMTGTLVTLRPSDKGYSYYGPTDILFSRLKVGASFFHALSLDAKNDQQRRAERGLT